VEAAVRACGSHLDGAGAGDRAQTF
jgi:hypothetical protein